MNNSIKIAFASSDGMNVDQHFGKAKSFQVFQISDQKAEFLEERFGRPFCHGGDDGDEVLPDVTEILADCAEVYVLQFGACAERALSEVGVQPIKQAGLIEDIVLKRVQNLVKT